MTARSFLYGRFGRRFRWWRCDLFLLGNLLVFDDGIGLADRLTHLGEDHLRLAALHAIVGRNQRVIAADR